MLQLVHCSCSLLTALLPILLVSELAFHALRVHTGLVWLLCHEQGHCCICLMALWWPYALELVSVDVLYEAGSESHLGCGVVLVQQAWQALYYGSQKIVWPVILTMAAY